MRIIKLAVISFIFLFLVITCISLFIPSQIQISKAVTINADKEAIMNQIKYPEKWRNWYPGTDSLKIYYVDGEAKGVTDKFTGFIVITGVKNDEVLATKTGSGLRKITMGWNIISGNELNRSTLRWHMDFHLRWYPWEKFRSLFFEKSYGSQIQTGLANLKALLEK